MLDLYYEKSENEFEIYPINNLIVNVTDEISTYIKSRMIEIAFTLFIDAKKYTIYETNLLNFIAQIEFYLKYDVVDRENMYSFFPFDNEESVKKLYHKCLDDDYAEYDRRNIISRVRNEYLLNYYEEIYQLLHNIRNIIFLASIENYEELKQEVLIYRKAFENLIDSL